MSEVNQAPLLDVRGLRAWYDESYVLQGMNFQVGAGEVVTLLGRNGAGKTTTLRAVMGFLKKTEGSIRHEGVEIRTLGTTGLAKRGIAYCPEERAIFASLTTEENLLLPPVMHEGGFSMDELYDLFPNLHARRDSQGTKLSGGEQQMLAIARILRTGCKFLLLDEPTEGLAPVLVAQIAEMLRMLKRKGYTILLVEQNYHFARIIADRHYIVERGTVVDSVNNGDSEKLDYVTRRYLSM